MSPFSHLSTSFLTSPPALSFGATSSKTDFLPDEEASSHRGCQHHKRTKPLSPFCPFSVGCPFVPPSSTWSRVDSLVDLGLMTHVWVWARGLGLHYRGVPGLGPRVWVRHKQSGGGAQTSGIITGRRIMVHGQTKGGP